MPPTPPPQQGGPIAPQAVSPTIWVERTFPDKSTNGDAKSLEARMFVTQPAVVKAEIARTINLGNYESLRIAVGVELPCYQEEVKVGLDVATEMVSTFIQQEEAAVKQLLQKRPAKA